LRWDRQPELVGRTSSDLRALLALNLLFISGGCSGDNDKGAAGKYYRACPGSGPGMTGRSLGFACRHPGQLPGGSPNLARREGKSKKVKIEDLSSPSATWERDYRGSPAGGRCHYSWIWCLGALVVHISHTTTKARAIIGA